MTRPANVLVAVVEVAVKCDATTSPTTESFVYGEVVPIPTLPLERMVIFAVSEGPIMRELAVVLMTDLPIATAPEALDVFPDPKATAPAPLAVLIYPIATEPTVPEELLLYPVATVRIPVFSSRRRHTRFKCDWSSDVCSSDLVYFYTRNSLVYAVSLISSDFQRYRYFSI